MCVQSSEIEYVRGIPETLRHEAVELYDAAFGAKFAVAVRSRTARINLVSKSFQLQFAVAAIAGDKLVGLAGFHTSSGSLTGGIDYRQLVSTLGLFRGNWAAVIFSLYERKPVPQELLLDGIAVHPELRGQGVGTRLLEELKMIAAEDNSTSIRLDVIDTNPAARRLYERNGFVATKTEHFGYLRWLLGFGASTTMICSVDAAL